MSDRPHDHAPRDSLITSSNEAIPPRYQSSPAPLDQYARPPPAHSTSAPSPTLYRQPSGNGRAMELPPLPQALSAQGGRFPPASRLAGLSSMLNPAEPEESSQARRRKASHLDSPSSSSARLPPLATSDPSFHPSRATPTPTSMNLPGSYGERPPRRILTPRSPSLQRAASLNQLNAPTSATYSAQQAPCAVSPRSRAYAIEPGTSGVPPLPTPPAGARTSYASSAPTPPVPASRRTSIGGARGQRLVSESTSPISSYSGHSQQGPGSPNALSSSTSMPTLSAAYSANHESSSSGGHERQRPFGVPISSSGGQNVYQMMTLETTSGTVQLPVDVQAASRVADEKRRRNAGASARFRQRRKEKEKEASTMISRLEQQMKEMAEDADFYKRERDYLAGVVLQSPGGDRHFPRPPSPRHRRSSSLAGYSASGSTGYAAAHEQGGRSPDDGRNVRRRTSTVSLPPPQAQNPAPRQPYQQGYPPQNYAQPLAPQSQPPAMHQPSTLLPAPSNRNTLPPPPPPPGPLIQLAPQTGPWNPYDQRRPGPPAPPGPPGQHRESR
ncbi:hypothetical protein CLAFUW4_02035 [Fulvia fulva]|uniref:BZIP domain-containing protein n=1 Tax=Passalora fulva TaxID=5499 RepID=A0A9Q8L7Z7_PASFU|nr:uncharacterized protein CLAFUR5_02029 [Fulvia fulva]KAK4634645.1 hypothetical protein CLAFUR4_02031 [Fulvia fulva]KAK4636696.1 hypothetical protein CLAFUR0_02034 [Fulvia fulva]UJO12499.1 hypothetical protein CLAFUR5_02029 [Fulvia fulva]WPV09381.1 hypothetical protein CLAFUW4_02035 [Fulvia fulva]WPV23362.1 hypothetical protein CLAFUW7_02035 [Fulvia fulva]